MLRTTLNIFTKSRQKILLKRRKVQLKNRAVSTKRLKQQQQKVNVSLEMKKLNIRKQMDKRKSPNHHLNQIIEDLFYPEIRLKNQEEVELRVKKITSDAFSREQEWQQMIKMDYLTSELLENTLPIELLEIYNSKGKQFKVEHYELLIKKMSNYCFNRQRIKQRRMQAWEKLMKKIKSKDPKVKEQRCPYLFLQPQQIPRHHYWQKFVNGMHRRIEAQNDLKEVSKYIPIMLTMSKTFNHIPAQLYQSVMNKNAGTSIESIRGEGVSGLLKLFKYRNKLKFNPNIKIELADEEVSKDHNHLHLSRQLATEVIEHPEHYSAQDLMNIFWFIRARRMRMDIIKQEQYPKLQQIFSQLLGEMSFESVQTFFVVYCSMNSNPNLQFAQILKYDLFRKAQECKKYYSLLDLIGRIKDRKLRFKVFQGKGAAPKTIQLEGYDLAIKIANVLTHTIQNLKSSELTQLVNCYYENDIREQSLLEFLATEVIRKGKQYDLQTISKSLFKITLLGHKSKIAAKYLLEQFSLHYFDQMKKHKEKGVFLLPTEQPVQQTKMNFSQIYLQQCLLMMLWTVTKQIGNRLQTDIQMTKMFELFPTKIESSDPLAIQLAQNINRDVKELMYFPKIKYPIFGAEEFPMGRLQQFYGKDFSKDEIEHLMEEEAKLTTMFTANYNPKSGLFLKERWSNANTYDSEQYIQFCIKNQEGNSESKNRSFFDQNIKLSPQFIQKRHKIVQKIYEKSQNQKKQSTKSASRINSSKIYELL